VVLVCSFHFLSILVTMMRVHGGDGTVVGVRVSPPLLVICLLLLWMIVCVDGFLPLHVSKHSPSTCVHTHNTCAHSNNNNNNGGVVHGNTIANSHVFGEHRQRCRGNCLFAHTPTSSSNTHPQATPIVLPSYVVPKSEALNEYINSIPKNEAMSIADVEEQLKVCARVCECVMYQYIQDNDRT
jgi:hypothetical protein